MATTLRKPNMLLIMTDQQRYDSLGCYGCRAIATPNLDRLAAGGVRFERCYANATICTPSRASIMTGKPLCGHGVYKLHDNLPLDERLFSERLRELGYTTALIGKLHVSGRVTEARERHPHDGFDAYEWCMDPGGLHFDSTYNAYAQWLARNHPDFLSRILREGRKTRHFPAEAHMSTWAAERTIAFLESRVREGASAKPFFCKMSVFDPHDPYFDYPREAADLVDLSALPDPVWDDERAEPVPADLRREQVRTCGSFRLDPDRPPTRKQIDEIRLGYYASVAFLDAQVGRVLEALERLGLAEDTLVLFVSDHGDMMGDHGLVTKGPHFYDPCSRVPFIMRLPGRVREGVRVSELVQPHDIAATVLAAAGLSPAELRPIMPHASDLVAQVNGQSPFRGYAVCEHRNAGYGPGGRYYDPPVHCTMFHDGRHKLTVYHRVGTPDLEPEGQLFDMGEDPLERLNLWASADRRELRARLVGRMTDWLVDTSSTYVGGRGGESLVWQSTY